jgi:hypothetical protein
MVKWIVKKGKLRHEGKTYSKGDTFEMSVKDAEGLPHGKLERVQESKQKKQETIETAPEPETVTEKNEPDATKG